MGATTKWLLKRELKKASTSPDETWPNARVDPLWEQFDQGTQRAILRLHRATDEAALNDLRTRLTAISQPALILWGDQDPWFPASTAEAYGSALPSAIVEHLQNAGHWPWLDDADALVTEHPPFGQGKDAVNRMHVRCADERGGGAYHGLVRSRLRHGLVDEADFILAEKGECLAGAEHLLDHAALEGHR